MSIHLVLLLCSIVYAQDIHHRQERQTTNCSNGGPWYMRCTSTGRCTQMNTQCSNGVCCPFCPGGEASRGLCPRGVCSSLTNVCVSGICCAGCAGGVQSAGICSANQPCTAPNTCQNGQCCPPPATTCPSGAASQGTCSIMQSCPIPYKCQNGQCCIQTTNSITGNPWITADANGKIVAAPVPDTTRDKPNNPGKEYLSEQIGTTGVYRFANEDVNAMFIVTTTGVVVVDAPLGRGDMMLAAIREVTQLPVTQLIYGHFHRDHMGDAGKFTTAEKIGHVDTAETLRELQDPNIPVPTRTFENNLTLTVGGKTIQLDYRGAFHAPGNLIVWLPNERVIYIVDAINPGWAPFIRLGVTSDVQAFLQSMGILLSYPFQTLVPGHNRLGTRQDVETMREYLTDLQTNAIQANRVVSWGDIMNMVVDQGNGALQTTLYQQARIVECARLTIPKWLGRLGGVDVYTPSNCDVVLFAQQFDYGDRIWT